MTDLSKTKNDHAALRLPIEHARAASRVRAEQIDDFLQERDWAEVAWFAAQCAQRKALRLKVWELPPCCVDPDDGTRAAKLLRKMLAAGVSRFHPDPLAALEEANTAKSR